MKSIAAFGGLLELNKTGVPITINIDPLTAGVAFLTLLGLVLVAWWQLHNMNKTSRASLLEQLNVSWSSLPIIEARRSLWQVINEATEKCKDEEGGKQRDTKVKVECGTKLNEMRESKEDKDINAYGRINDLWGFFEMVGYFASRNYVSKKDVFEIYAGPVVLAWQASENHIDDKRPSLGAKEDKGKNSWNTSSGLLMKQLTT